MDMTDSSSPVRKSTADTRAELRVSNEPGLVLHTYPYKETSLIVEAFTRHHGRVALVARGAKRPRSALRGTLLAFRPLSLGWVRPRNAQSELLTLSRAEWLGGVPGLSGSELVCGFYINELLMRLLPRDDAHEALFDVYLGALAGLACGEPQAVVLRQFEYALLREMGYALQLSIEGNGKEPLEPDQWYRYVAERGAVRSAEPGRSQPGVVLGKTLYDIAAGDYSDPRTASQSKMLMRQLLQHHLAGQQLHTRQMMIDLNDL
jgi:DNA repair protein RecO (recombination protein O)